MKSRLILTAVLALALALASTPAACRQPQDAPPLARLQPETRQRMKLVMAKVGSYYLRLESSVDKGFLADAATQAQAVATLGAYLAPQRDPAIPPEYVILQAEFDEAARELADAARKNDIQLASRSFDDLTAACTNCHQAFRVSLQRPYQNLAYDPRSPVKEPTSHAP